MATKTKLDPKRREKLEQHVNEAREQINSALDELAEEADWALADELLRKENYRLGSENESLSAQIRKLEEEVSLLRTRIQKTQQALTS